MDRQVYVQPSARVRVMEKQLIARTLYERLVEAPGMSEFFLMLNETPYGDSFQKMESPQDYESVLKKELDKVFDEISRLAPEKELVELIQLKYDYHNYKALIKELLSGEESEGMYLPHGSQNIEKDRAMLLAMDEKQREKLLPDFYQKVMEVYQKNKDPQFIDIMTDVAYFKELRERGEKLGVPMIMDFIRDKIDFTNLMTLFRMKKQLKNLSLLKDFMIPGGLLELNFFQQNFFEPVDEILKKLLLKPIGKAIKQALKAYEHDGRVASMAKSFDEFEISKINEAKRINYGPEVLFSYLMNRENEIKNLRTMIVSKMGGVKPETIRSRLRGVYV